MKTRTDERRVNDRALRLAHTETEISPHAFIMRLATALAVF